MSIRTGVLRIATVIRGAGWLAAVLSLAIGLGTGITEGWQAPENPFNRFDDPKAHKPQTQQGYKLLDENHPSRDFQTKRLLTDEEVFGQNQKEFSFMKMQFGYMLAGLVVGAILLGLAYISAWVLVGFAPGN